MAEESLDSRARPSWMVWMVLSLLPRSSQSRWSSSNQALEGFRPSRRTNQSQLSRPTRQTHSSASGTPPMVLRSLHLSTIPIPQFAPIYPCFSVTREVVLLKQWWELRISLPQTGLTILNTRMLSAKSSIYPVSSPKRARGRVQILDMHIFSTHLARTRIGSSCRWHYTGSLTTLQWPSDSRSYYLCVAVLITVVAYLFESPERNKAVIAVSVT